VNHVHTQQMISNRIPLSLSDTEKLTCKGNEYYAHRLFANAAEQYQAALSIDQNLTDAYYRLGSTYVERSKYPEALVEYKKGIALGKVYENLPGTERAIHSYEMLLTHSANKDIASFLLGEAYLKNGANEKARKKYLILRAMNSSYSNQLLQDIEKYPNPRGFDFSGLEEISDKQKCAR
jgi:tetratricopeptide (TPR) repeat protein